MLESFGSYSNKAKIITDSFLPGDSFTLTTDIIGEYRNGETFSFNDFI